MRDLSYRKHYRQTNRMKWYLLIVALMSYGAAELTRYICQYHYYYGVHGELIFIKSFLLDKGVVAELILMWVAFLAGISIMAWRLQRKEERNGSN